MRLSVRFVVCVLAGASALTSIGCNSVPGQWHRQSALVNRRLHSEKQALAQTQSALDQDRQRLAQENADLQQRLAAANARLDNLSNERSQLQSRYTNLMKSQQSVLSDSATQKFKDLAKQYKGLEFDETTGVSRLSNDALFEFASGSTQIKDSAKTIIGKIAGILTEGDNKHLKVLVVGHTDDRRISKESTKKVHPTNWHLSTNRANEVLLALNKAGISENRMVAVGHSMWQPLEPNSNESGRSKNRRVEIMVVAPDSPIAMEFERESAARSASNKDEWDPRMAK